MPVVLAVVQGVGFRGEGLCSWARHLTHEHGQDEHGQDILRTNRLLNLLFLEQS